MTLPPQPVVLITGGSRGIGAATARLAAQRGYDVCLSYVQAAQAADAVVGEIRAAGRQALAVQADMASEKDIEQLFQRAEALGPLTGLVNNAGIVAAQSRLDAMSAQRITRMMAINVTGAMLCAREAVRRMSTRHGGNGGAIVNVSSAAARLGAAGEYVDYAASKAAIDTLTMGLAGEVAAEGIRVNAVRPGFIYTDIHADGGESGRVARLAPSLPMARGGEPEEVARAILWLLGEEASYTTGAFIDVAGGR